MVWKIGLIVALVLFSVWELMPSVSFFSLSPQQRQEMDPGRLDQLRSKALNLGLDLQGGIHLVMEVDTQGMSSSDANDAVDRAMTVIANRVDQFGLTEPVVQREGERRIIIELPGMQDVERAKRLIGQTARLEFKLLKDEEDIRYLVDRIDLAVAGQDTMAAAEADTTESGLFEEEGGQEENANNLSQYFRYQQLGSGNPGFNILVAKIDVPRVSAIIDNPQVQQILEAGRAVMVWGPENERADEYRLLYFANLANEMTGDMIADARVSTGSGIETGQNYILMDSTSDGAREWSRITGANVGRRVAIVLDNTCYVAPNIEERIYGGSSRIKGSFTIEEARDIAIVLRAGALPASVNIIEDRTVGPSLGADSIRKSRLALIIGLVVVIIFMVAYYLGAGLIAVVALALNMLFILAYLAFFHATLTLPGMAGIILTIGMAVDANVLIYERIREELRLGNTTRASVANGYLRARWTILDANITTFLTAIILYNFGTGPIKGFALTLMVGIVSSVFTALFVTRIIFDILTHYINLSGVSLGKFSVFHDSHFKFMANRKKGFIVSGTLILAGLISLAVHGGPKYSIDFLGGTLLELHFDQPVQIAEIRDALRTVDVPGTDLATSEIKFLGTGNTDVIIRIVNAGDMEETDQQVKDALATSLASKVPANRSDWILREELVGPSIGNELKGQALWAILFSLIVLIVYITIRFEFKFSVGAILALVHDVLITVGIFSLLNKEIGLTIIAALLTIVGYSLNDTIVVFDRIRERLRSSSQRTYLETLDVSVNETLSRTIITSFTTLLTVLALFLFGGSVINDFSFALLVGVIVGTYSSIFVATPLLAEWYLRTADKKRQQKRRK